MSKELRLAFALGGGTSLGAFSGSALSEAIKLAILRGQQSNNGEPYTKVTIDVFSGASAGALTLGLMLRSLAQPDSGDRAGEVRDGLQQKYGEEFTGPSSWTEEQREERRKDLVAAQLLQEQQKEVWSSVNLDGLLATDKSRDFLRHEGGLLDRGFIEEIARNAFKFEDGIDLSGRRLLGDRVLFAATLTSVTPILADAREELLGRNTGPQTEPPDREKPGYRVLADAVTSKYHTDLRVFDLHFEADGAAKRGELETPKNWYPCHPEDLAKEECWSAVAATALASGAFPIAFSPIPITRLESEHPKWPDDLKNFLASQNLQQSTTDGQELRPGGQESRTDDQEEAKYPFTYVDGGTFNNQPIREAFRLAAFMDSLNPEGTTQFDRRIIFIDSSIGSVDIPVRVPIHQEYFLEEPNVTRGLDGYAVRRRTTMDRLLPHVGSLLSAFFNEGRVIEADKVFTARNNFRLRDELLPLLLPALEASLTPALIKNLRDSIAKQLQARFGKKDEPAKVTLEAALHRILRKNESLRAKKEGVHDFVTADHPVADALWLKALLILLFDLMLDTADKDEHAEVIAIGPWDLENDEVIPLLSAKLFAFAGFMSEVAPEQAIDVGKFCAQTFLEATELIKKVDGDTASYNPINDDMLRAFNKDLEVGLGKLTARIEQIIRQSHLLNVFPGVDALLLSGLAAYIGSRIPELLLEKPATQTFEVRIRAHRQRLEFDGKGALGRDLGTTRLHHDGDLYLVTFLSRTVDGGYWDGPPEHVVDVTDGNGVTQRALQIHRNGVGPIGDRKFCTIELPDANHPAFREALALPHPVLLFELSDDHRRQDVPADEWKAWPGFSMLQGLEATLLS